MAFCPVCGDEAVDVFCEACLREREPLVAEIRPFTHTTCTQCDRIMVRNHWTDEKEFSQLVEKAVVFNKRAHVRDVRFPRPVVEGRPKEFVLPLAVEGTVSDAIAPYIEEYEVLIPLAFEECDRCSLAKSSYFEGVLQLRNPRDEVVSMIEREVQRNRDVFITGAKDVRGGIDFQFTDQQYLHALAHQLHKEFGGTIKTQSKLHTYDSQTSKMVFRLTVLLRLPEFWKGDILETEKRLLRVTKMGSQVRGWDLRRRKNTSVPCPQPEEALVHESVEVVLSSVQPKPMILDPETYQEVPLAHPVSEEPGGSFRAVQDSRGKWYLTDRLPSERDE